MFKFLVVFLKVLAMACIIGVALRVIDVVFFKEEIKDNQQIISSNESEQIPANESSQIVENELKENAIIKENNEKETQTVSNNKVAVTKNDETKVEQASKEENITTKKQEQQTPIMEEQKQEQQAEPVVQETITSVIEEQQVVQNEERYVKNGNMIETMESAINSNSSESMNTYGYEIVVDSSITELTNQFTYTEYRLTSKLNNRFGTIKIYAQDYYRNGQYVNTQCFIY